MEGHMSWVKIVAINCLVFFLLVLFAEMAARVAWTIRSCFNSKCELSRVANVKILDAQHFASTFRGISRFDGQLGFVPQEGFEAVITERGWTNNKVTISEQGFRANDVQRSKSSSEVLVVGDSFTFGDQVSNHETWPACLERKLGRGVDNAGVFGYGAAQSLKRATLILSKRKYSTLILSVLVGADFERDRLIYRFGFARPAMIRSSDGLKWSEVPDPDRRGTKYNPNPNRRYFALAYERSLLLSSIANRLYPESDISGDNLTVAHPNAADTEEIILFTLREFSQLSVEKKILLLQYSKNLEHAKVIVERKIIERIAKALSLFVVDTIDVLAKEKPAELWNGHHTPYGNEVVCDYLLAKGFR